MATTRVCFYRNQLSAQRADRFDFDASAPPVDSTGVLATSQRVALVMGVLCVAEILWRAGVSGGQN